MTNLDLTAEQENELMAAFRTWYALWCAAGNAYDTERTDLDAQAAAVFRDQLAKGGAYSAAWIMIQNTLSTWWELPEQMREWFRATETTGDTFAAHAAAAVVALDADADDE